MEDQNPDVVIRRRLSDVTPVQWEAIADARHGLLGGDGTFGSWGGGQHTASGAIQMPYAIEGPEIRAARDAILFVAFDWMSWPRRRELSSIPELWPGMTAEDGVKLWVAQVRAARFAEGSLLAAAEGGLLAAALTAVLHARPSR